jgi:hypothetical protein
MGNSKLLFALYLTASTAAVIYEAGSKIKKKVSDVKDFLTPTWDISFDSSDFDLSETSFSVADLVLDLEPDFDLEPGKFYDFKKAGEKYGYN